MKKLLALSIAAGTCVVNAAQFEGKIIKIQNCVSTYCAGRAEGKVYIDVESGNGVNRFYFDESKKAVLSICLTALSTGAFVSGEWEGIPDGKGTSNLVTSLTINPN